MSHIRTAILTAIKTAIVALPDIESERVTIGAPAVALLSSGRPIISIRWLSDSGRRADGGLRERIMRVVVAVMVTIDPTSSVEPLLQMSEIYDDIHAALETLSDADISSSARGQMIEAGGIEVGTHEDNTNQYTYIASMWDITYERQMGGV